MTVPATPGANPTNPVAAPVVVDPQQQAPTPAPIEQPATPPQAAPEAIGANPAPAAEDAGITYRPTGDAGLDIALGFMGARGLGPDHPAIMDAVDGKFDKLEAHLSALGDKAAGFESYVELAKQAYERNKSATEQRQTAITSVVTEVAGGAEAWATIKEWAGKNADPAEKEAINAMLSAGPVQARAAAFMLAAAHRSAGGTVVTPADPTTKAAGNNGPTNNGALSPKEYADAVRETRARLGSRFDSSPEYQALQARRSAWRG